MASVETSSGAPMGKGFGQRMEDSTFELNLAPMLDIIVSIVPMLLMSVAFVHITVVETPIPQAVEKAIAAANEKNKDLVQITLAVSKQNGFRYTIVDKGQTKERTVALKNNAFDLEALHTESMSLKKEYPDVFRLELNPEESIDLNEIIAVLDHVRMTGPKEPKVVFKDEAGKPLETNLVFPDVTFGNVAGG
jgi:biopolymer transport protein ExbD